MHVSPGDLLQAQRDGWLGSHEGANNYTNIRRRYENWVTTLC